MAGVVHVASGRIFSVEVDNSTIDYSSIAAASLPAMNMTIPDSGYGFFVHYDRLTITELVDLAM
ncbi:hypothetical protein ACP70R_017928 [Stipagrostis hirtigluma subsp. patula]